MSAFKISVGAVGVLLAAFLGVAAAAPERVADEQEAKKVQGERSAAMKSMGGAMRTLKLYTAGRGSAEDATKAAASIAWTAAVIPSLFPAGTGMDVLSDSESKPEIWQQWDAFTKAAKTLEGKAAVLTAALAAGDKGKIGDAFADLGRNGCAGCHRVFRQKR